MALSKEYLNFILERLSELEDITYRTMMGEYIIYYHGKIVSILDRRTQATIRNHFLRYPRKVKNRVKVIKRNTFGFSSFKNFKKRILIALNIKKERTNCVLSRC